MLTKRGLLGLMLCVGLLCSTKILYSQIIKGKVIDASENEELIGATIVLLGQSRGVATDANGEFSIPYSGKFPATLQISYVGYVTQELAVKSETDFVLVKMKLSGQDLEEVKVQDIRISERIKQAPLTIETMDPLSIKQNPASNFYEGLANLKGVDITSASIGFKIINTRGFNSTSPVRTLQLIDGVDNQAPGLNFSLGNFLGASELDVERVDLIAGASSAFYGPGAFNGVINMYSKSPFKYPGLSVMIKGGERNLFEGSFRIAQAYKGKKGFDRWAWKLNFFYMRADDWEAENYEPTEQSPSPAGNPGGWDAVNIYGDEYQRRNNASDIPLRSPGLGTYYRTGYREIDLVDYNTENLKANAAVHYFINKKVEAIYAFNYGSGTTVYQGDNRFSLRNIQFFQNRLEVRQKDRFFVRVYSTNEDAGDSYDGFNTALILQESAKDDADWSKVYANYWNQNIVSIIERLPGFPPFDPDNPDPELGQKRQQFLNEFYADSLAAWHSRARQHTDYNAVLPGQSPRFTPGTPQYDSALQATTARLNNQGGSRFFDRSALYHAHAEYQFDARDFGADEKWAQFRIGGNYRIYRPNSNGTIFSDTNGRVITNTEYGAYVGAEKKFLSDLITVSVTVRMDKNENFNHLFSPAASLVYNKGIHVFRASFSAAIRNPTLTDQYFNLNVGRAKLLGNLSGFDSLATVESFTNYINNLRPELIEYFNVDPVKPERVKTIELGYRVTINKRLFIDASGYMSWYTDFLGFKIGVDFEVDAFNFPRNTQVYRVTTNSKDLVTTTGAALGINYFVRDFISLTGNYSYNSLNRRGSSDPIIPAFNTPLHKFNIGVNGNDITSKVGKSHIRHWGYSVNFRWVDGFMFEGSPQFTGFVPQYEMVDAMLNWRYPKWKSTFKLGANNLLNNKVIQVYGGPKIGRLIYMSIIYELDKL